jgi:hypothetical protein
MNRSILLFFALASPVLAQKAPGIITQFPQFGGVNDEHFRRSNITLQASQVVNELNTVKSLLAGPRVPQVYKQALANLANDAIAKAEALRTLAQQNAGRPQLAAADAPLDVAMQQLTTQAGRFTQFAPGLAESLQRLDHADQQLHAAVHHGGGGLPNPDFQLARIRRLADSLQNQTESLRDLANSINDGTPAGRGLEQAARSLSFRASRFERQADAAAQVPPLTNDFATAVAAWRSVAQAMSTTRPGREFRLQATRVEGTLRNIGELIPANPPWDFDSGIAPPPIVPPVVPPGPGIQPIIPPIGSCPGFLNRGAIVLGAGVGGGPRVRLYTDLTGEPVYDFFAYDNNFIGGVRVATADLTGDGVPDLVVGPGPGMPPLIRVFNGRNMRLLTEFYAFDVQWTGGVWVAAAERTRTGQSWVAVSADTGAGPHVKVFDLAQGREIDSFFAFDQRLRGGCRVALGDVNGDGTPDVIAAAGPGMEPRVKIFDGRNRAVMGDFLAFEQRFINGLTVDASDITRNGRTDIIVGTDLGGQAMVRVFDANNARKIGEMSPFPRGFAGGVCVAGYDFDGDGVPDIVCAPGRDGNWPALPARVYSGVNARLIGEFFPFGNQFRGGAYIGSR